MIGLLFDNDAQTADLLRQPNGPYINDPGLETAVTISLFTDAQPDGAPAPDPGEMRKGWWADAYPMTAGERPPGSRIWSRRRNGLSSGTLRDLEQDAEDALAWLVADGVATDVIATATAVTTNACLLAVEILGSRLGPFKQAWKVPNAIR